MKIYFIEERDDDNVLLSNGHLIIERDIAMDIIEKVTNFYNTITDEEIKEYNYNVKKECEESMTCPFSKEKKMVEHEEYISKFDNARCTLSLKEIEHLYENEKIFEAEIIDIRDLVYPLIVTLYKGDKIVHIGINTKNLDKYISNIRDDFDFDTYSILSVKEKDKFGIYAHLRLIFFRFNDKNDASL